MTTQHTPGPWSIRTGGGQPIEVIPPINIRGTICELDNEANARLIAAAPELLEALTALLTCTELNMDDMEQETRELIGQAQAVILKATGDKVGTGGAQP